MSGKVRGKVIGKITLFPILAVMIFFVIGYQEAYAISYQSTIGVTGVLGNDNSHFNVVEDIAVDSSGKIHVVDENAHRVQIFDSAGTYQLTIGVPGISGADNSHLKFPDSVAVDSSGKIYVEDTDNHRIQIFDSAGTYQSTIGVSGVPGSDNAHFNFPGGVAVDSSGNIYVADTNNHRIQIFDSAGTYQSTIGVTGIFNSDNLHLNSPDDVIVDSSGKIYVADTGNQRIQIFDSAGVYQSTIGVSGAVGSDNSHFSFPAGVAVDSSGNIYVADTGNHRIQIFDSAGTYQSTIGVSGVPGSDNDHLNSPDDVAVDSSGNIYVGDSFNYRVQIFSGLSASNTLRAHSGGDALPSHIKPSFGGVGNMVFADGLTINGKVYDLGNFAVSIPKNILNVGQPEIIKIKEQLAYGPSDWDHVAIYMNFEGKDPEIYNSHLILSNDKNDGFYLYDPKGFVRDSYATTSLDSQYVHTVFGFTATKAMADTSMIVSAWDGHKRVNNVYVAGAIQFGDDPPVQVYHSPDWLHEYTNVQDIGAAVENAGYQKPLIFSHIADSNQVWKGSDGGSVKWILDDSNKTVSIVIYDNNGNSITEKTEPLKIVNGVYAKCTDSKNCMYSWSVQGQLSGTNSGQLDKAKKAEEDRVSITLHKIGYITYFDHAPIQ